MNYISVNKMNVQKIAELTGGERQAPRGLLQVPGRNFNPAACYRNIHAYISKRIKPKKRGKK